MDIGVYSEEIQKWLEEVNAARGRDASTVIDRCTKLEQYGLEINDDYLVAYASFFRGETFYLLNDVVNFYPDMLQALRKFDGLQEWGYVVMANNMLGIMSLNSGNTSYAIDYYTHALEICDKYSTPSLMWMVDVNIAQLYVTIEEWERATQYFEIALSYVIGQEESREKTQNLSVIYIGIAKANIEQDLINTAKKYLLRYEKECEESLSEIDKIAYYSIAARMSLLDEDEEGLSEIMVNLRQILQNGVPIMDVHSDVFYYMDVLLDAEKFDEFKTIYPPVARMCESTNINNLRRQLVTLRIKYHLLKGDNEKFRNDTVDYYELSRALEHDNKIMVMDVINMKYSLNSLAEKNKEMTNENQQLHRKSEIDALTGLYNRFKLDEDLQTCFEYAKKHSTPFAIEILDVDFFKEYNDNYGHQAGDGALVFVSNLIKKVMLLNDVYCYRYGGDEFVIIYEGFSFDEAKKVAADLKEDTISQALPHQYSKAADILTISQGISWGIPTWEDAPIDFLHAADANLYTVKQRSKNDYEISKYEK